ncbi:uncharacterized protein LOC128546976 [Mercenaria mercenaria]|uniref:uncharacterized protein LOC128546976 n=1 Tax=Mercenaria mercenaria TaxID=6596 RepID=UPI00234E3868|nr:uncharacterized protein LOC128546976 [Mercenaria mercenaria]
MDCPTKPRSPRIAGGYKGSVGAYCCVPGCTNAQGRCNRMGMKLSFYSFPKDVKQRKLWLSMIRRDVIDDNGKTVPFEPKSHSRVCSAHFVGGSRSSSPVSAAYVPSIFPRNSTLKRQTKRAQAAGEDTPKTPKSNKRKKGPETETSDMAGRPKVKRHLNFPESVWETTDHDYVKYSNVCVENVQSESKLYDLEKENEELKAKQLRLENIKDNDEKFQFYTNLPNYAVFAALCNYLKSRTKSGVNYWRGKSTGTSTESPVTSKGPERKFTVEEEIFIVLVKLKTGNFNEDLAQTFDTSQAHISRLFTTWINVLCTELKLLFEMQSNEAEKAECYSSFNDLKIVIDCTELMVQRASNLDSRKKTFSNYKHHDTVKFLVGLSPNLAVNYVSKAWGGRSSDKHITLNSEALMNGLSAGETVMADRGFTINNDLKKKGVKLLIPEFKGRDRPQISKKEANRSEFISKARIHVERIIQRMKTFYHLERIIRLNMQDLVEQIFTVCAYLTNFQLPIIRR